MTPFSALLGGFAEKGGVYTVDLPDDWRQGRTAYGGISAALCYEVARRTVDLRGALRSAQIAFIGPATGSLTARADVLRQGKSTVFAGVDLAGEAGLAVRALFCFAAERESAFDLEDLPAPDVAAPEDCADLFRPGLGPAFMQHFEPRLAFGPAPVTGGERPDVAMWLRHRDEGARGGMAALIALADAPPPAAMGLFKQPAPISTMTWMIDVVEPAPETEDGWWLCRSTGQTVRHGYSAQAMKVWNRAGRPVLVGRQSVAVFA